jgi:hypothetical protein
VHGSRLKNEANEFSVHTGEWAHPGCERKPAEEATTARLSVQGAPCEDAAHDTLCCLRIMPSVVAFFLKGLVCELGRFKVLLMIATQQRHVIRKGNLQGNDTPEHLEAFRAPVHVVANE